MEPLVHAAMNDGGRTLAQASQMYILSRQVG